MAGEQLLIEELADAAWPASEQVTLGPWKLRATPGAGRRANSVFTARPGPVDSRELVGLIRLAEGFYRDRLLPVTFQVSDCSCPDILDRLLEDQGYQVITPSEIWVASTHEALSCIGREPAVAGLRSAAEPWDHWIDCAFEGSAHRREVHEQLLARVPSPRLFVAVERDGQTCSCGMGVSGRGHTGIFCMSTREAMRRQGLASEVLGGLMRWALQKGDGQLYLQVMTGNLPARGLYQRCGFARSHKYHYRVKAAML